MMSTDKIIENLRGFQLCNYSSSALTFTVHDIIASMEEEVEQIWKKPCTNLKLLYISIRVVSLGSQLISTGLTLRLTGTGPASLRSCRVIAGLQGASSQVLMMAVQTILILRVQALFHEKIYLMRFLRGLFFLEIVLMTILFILGLPQLQFGLHCVITFFPGIVVGYFVSPMLFEFLLFVLTMIKFYHAIRDGWGQENVVTRFLKDGIWAFALPFAILTVNTLCLGLLSGSISSVAYSWVIAIPGFAGCRLILNMSHLLQPHRMTITQTTDHELTDTLILTHLTRTPTSSLAFVDHDCS